MANGDGWSQGDREELGVLRTRMTNVERAIQSVGDNVAALSAKFDKKSEIPWQALGVMLGFVGLIGGALYWPIREGQSELKSAMVEVTKVLSRDFVTIRELDNRSARTVDERKRLELDITNIERDLVPRGEHTERWRGFDNQVANLQRQIDDQKKAFGDTYSLRDAMQQYRRELDDLRQRVTAR